MRNFSHDNFENNKKDEPTRTLGKRIVSRKNFYDHNRRRSSRRYENQEEKK